MADTLLIHYDPARPEQTTWSSVNSQGELTTRIASGLLEDVVSAAENQRVIVILDSSSVHLNHVNLPTSNIQKMLRAIPYALEEQIAEDVEDFHFVISKSTTSKGTPVVGIRKDILASLLDNFNQHGIHVDAVIPDALCLPAAPEQWSALTYNDKALLQYEANLGTIIDANNLRILLHSLISHAEPKPEKLVFLYPDGSEPDNVIDGADDDVEVIQVAYNTHPLVVFCGEYTRAMPLNLLQGEFKPKRKNTGHWYRWRLAASLVAVWLVLYLGMTAIEVNKLKNKNKALSAEITNIYKKTFPQSKRIVNARVQMEQKLKELKSGGTSDSQFLALLTSSVETITSQKKITINSINFRNNRMDVGLTGPDLQTVESLNTGLNAVKEIKSEIVSATSEKNNVKGSIRLQMKGS